MIHPKVSGAIGVVGLPAAPLAALESNIALAFAKTQTPFARQQLVLGIIEKKEAALILILWMEPGRTGTRGVDAASRVAQDGRLALALVRFHLPVTGDPVRGMHGIGQAATSDAVSCKMQIYSLHAGFVELGVLTYEYNFQAILLMDPGALGRLGAIAAPRVAWA